MGLFRKQRAIDAELWQPGDMAECLNDEGWWRVDGEPGVGPRRGEVRGVRKVVTDYCEAIDGLALFLHFERYKGGFYAPCFRKVRPGADELIAAESAFTDLIRKQHVRCPVRVAP